MKKNTHHLTTAIVVLSILLLGTLSFSIKEGYETFVLRNQVQYLKAHIGVLHRQSAVNNQYIKTLAEAMIAAEAEAGQEEVE